MRLPFIYSELNDRIQHAKLFDVPLVVTFMLLVLEMLVVLAMTLKT